jgi:hypothetical protein
MIDIGVKKGNGISGIHQHGLNNAEEIHFEKNRPVETGRCC